jgi:AcrR family transcriptional regulator
MAPATDTKRQIILVATELIKSEGAEGLSLRKVATAAGLSLSNLQYHYAGKQKLLAGVAAYYTELCLSLLAAFPVAPATATRRESLRVPIAYLMSHVDHLSDMCIIFRELWALSSRNAEMAEQLGVYYQGYADGLVQVLCSPCGGDGPARRVVALLIPYVEGYSVSGTGLELDTDATVDMLTDLSVALLDRA